MAEKSAGTPSRPLPASAPVPAGVRARPGSGDGRVALLFVAPALLGFAVFLVWPTLRGIYLSFTRYTLLSSEQWVGLDNYRRLVNDPVFWNSLGVTLEYVVINIGVQTLVALLIAVLMHRLTRSPLLRGAVLAPYLVSNVVAGIVWLWILDTQLGVGNEVLAWLGLERIAFFGDAAWAIPTIALVNVWRHMGYTALLIEKCQNLVGKDATVFPATAKGTRAAIATHRKNGIDVSPFTRHVEEGTTFSFPVTDHAADVKAIMLPVMQDIYSGETSVDALDEANEQINFLFEQDK